VPHCFSTGILVAASLHFTAAIAGATFSEFSVAGSPLVNGILARPFALDAEGRVPVPTGPGLGISLNDELIERLRYR
jgi:L-alanine-DL-glutamate epimerase-like enolase superfamily enzyme